MQVQGTGWFKSSRSAQNGDCVEVSTSQPGVVPVRDSKDPAGSVLVFTAEVWSSSVSAVKRGELPA
ncbi:hypothetical protein AQ490_11425 [Wenjunlia vitaminophila]|uniref:DUF397 domain-containing protein n=1 Tax=Wenjunlia vitaminophila TaxID=76728 RepID=A0A0T6LK81_WENVI|nr:DUF397 domain-containing protein [Wenjunlia vitaminophila]KRV46499.1 hypothetical protein AQ490_11425 [Wenjunlia vitaminophila]